MIDNISYFDGIGDIRVTNGMVHIELMALVSENEGEPLKPQTLKNLVIPLPQYIRLCLGMANSLEVMEEKGIIHRKEKQAAAKTPSPNIVQPTNS